MADEEKAAAPAKKSRKPMMVIGAIVVLALAGGGYFWKTQKAHSESQTAELAKVDLYLPLDPPFVVNFKDGESLRYLQVGVTLMSRDPKAIDAAKSAGPEIRDALVSLFSNQEYSVIINAAGRRKLQDQALETVRRIVNEHTGKPGIDALYFTSFVMQ